MKPLSPFSSFSSFFCFFLFLSLSFSSSTSYVSAAQVEIIVNNSTEFQNAFSTVISSPNYTTITINASLTCDFTFAVNKNFTLRSTPGRVYTITFAPLISVSLGGLSTSAVAYQTIQDLILTRPIGNNNNFFIAAYGVMNFINVVFRNVAGGSTKAVTLTSVTALFENCQFISNDCGRTLLLEDSPTTLTGCTFHNNSKAILAYDNFLDFIVTIHNCTFTNNWAVDELIYGGAITSWDIGMRISNSKFYNNIARNGGAIQFGANYLEPKNALQITNCQFDNNTAIEVSVGVCQS